MTTVTVPASLGGDGLPFSDDGSSARDMLGQGYAQHFFPMVNQIMTANQAVVDAVGAVAAGSTNTSSTSSLEIGTGAKSLTVETGKSLVPGMWMLLAYRADPTKYMIGQITTYNAGTGALALAVSYVRSSGTFADWAGSITGRPGFDYSVGDIHTGVATPMAGTWLPVDGGIYLQSAYPELFAKLGAIADTPGMIRNFSGNSLAPVSLGGVAWTGSEFVAVQGANISKLGPNGSAHTAVTHSYTALGKIASNGLTSGNVTVALMSSGTVSARSTDGGATWANGGAVPSGNYNNLVWGNGQFVGMNSGLTITSPDAVAWTSRGTTTSVSQGSLAFMGDNTWLIGQNTGGLISRSTDNAQTWTAGVATGLTGSVSGFARIGDLTVAAGVYGSSLGIAVSRDKGATWTVVWTGELVGGTGVRSVLAVANMVVVLSNQGLTWTTSGIEWQQITGLTGLGTNAGSDIATDGTRLVMTNGSGTAPAVHYTNKFLTYTKATQFAVPRPTGPVQQWIKAV